ncbi:MAG TPA: NAD(P)-binding protein [Planctomycetota bacterium]|nr:NAD(P)-binding protein [Planctomycetota bacterium]
MASEGKHVVAIVGGAVSGSVAAEILANKGIEVIVIEQNPRPYGKIEDGLPRWHAKQRRMEYGKIDARLDKPNIHFVPKTMLGRDLDFEEMAKGWGLSALLLANGAWRDRPLELAGVDEYVNRGLVYQNPFIYWFNHKNEKSYDGPRYEVPEGCLCVGGGLASIDVIKVIQLELYERALKKKGIEVDMYHLEHEGIPDVCKEHGIDDPKSLGVKDGFLIYRRRTEDMPLANEPENATPEQKKRTEATRKKILDKCQEKFLFRFEDRRLSQKPIVEGGRLKGIVAAETKVEGRKADPIPGSEREIRSDLIISSIGSVPEKIKGINMKGEYYTYKSWETGEYEGVPGVFGLGNVVTGQGNIQASFKHGQFVAKHLIENYLGVGESRDISAAQAPAQAKGAASAEQVAQHVQKKAPLPEAKVKEILDRVRRRQKEVGFEGGYKTWIQKNTPSDLE